MSDALRLPAETAFRHILAEFPDNPPRLVQVRWKLLDRYEAYEFTARLSNGSHFVWLVQRGRFNHRDLERATPIDNPFMDLYAHLREEHLLSRGTRQNLLEARREWMRREATQLAQYYDFRFIALQEEQRRMHEEQSIVRRLLGTLASTENPETRAIAALKDWLTPDQRQQYEKNGHFDVIGCDSKMRYRIYSASTFNIICQDNEVYCLTLAGNLPLGDNMLMQAIGLELDETAALAVANRRSAAMPPEVGLNHCTNCRWDVALEEPLAMVDRDMTPEQRHQIITDLIQAQDRMMRETLYADHPALQAASPR